MKKAILRLGAFLATTVLCTLMAVTVHPLKVSADPELYLGQIFLTGENFCPRYTHEADGSTMSIEMNTALYSLFGTTYGGDGRNTFSLPKLDGPVKGTLYCVATYGTYPSRS